MKCTLLLLLLGVLPLAAPAQITLGQPTLDEQKAQIWCAAIKFVYDDTGTPALKKTVWCGGSLKALENSIKADKQGVYSLLYQPLEGRGAMYKGLSSDKARLQKLRDEIINRLKASPSRRGSPVRLRAVDALAATLTTYVDSGTPPGDVGRAPEAGPDTLTDEAPAGITVDPADNPNYAPPAPAGNRDGVLSSLFAPISFILALLALVLFWLLRGTLKAVAKRVDQHRKELEWVRAGTVGAPAAAAGAFTPAQHAEVEKLVRQRVAAELQRLLEMEQAAATDEMPAPPPTPAPASFVASPAVYSPPAAPHPETPIPAGPPSAAPHDEFNSLVAPVQLPGSVSEPDVVVGAPVRRYYAAAPTNGAFSEQNFSAESQADSLYEITLDFATPDAATFQVNADPTVYAAVFDGHEHRLRAACTYPQPEEPVQYIVNDAPGTLRRDGNTWQIEQPARVHFE